VDRAVEVYDHSQDRVVVEVYNHGHRVCSQDRVAVEVDDHGRRISQDRVAVEVYSHGRRVCSQDRVAVEVYDHSQDRVVIHIREVDRSGSRVDPP